MKALGRENIDELLKLSEEYGVDRRLNFEVPVVSDPISLGIITLVRTSRELLLPAHLNR